MNSKAWQAKMDVLLKEVSKKRDRLPECRNIRFAKKKMARQIRDASPRTGRT